MARPPAAERGEGGAAVRQHAGAGPAGADGRSARGDDRRADASRSSRVAEQAFADELRDYLGNLRSDWERPEVYAAFGSAFTELGCYPRSGRLLPARLVRRSEQQRPATCARAARQRRDPARAAHRADESRRRSRADGPSGERGSSSRCRSGGRASACSLLGSLHKKAADARAGSRSRGAPHEGVRPVSRSARVGARPHRQRRPRRAASRSSIRTSCTSGSRCRRSRAIRSTSKPSCSWTRSNSRRPDRGWSSTAIASPRSLPASRDPRTSPTTSGHASRLPTTS